MLTIFHRLCINFLSPGTECEISIKVNEGRVAICAYCLLSKACTLQLPMASCCSHLICFYLLFFSLSNMLPVSSLFVALQPLFFLLLPGNHFSPFGKKLLQNYCWADDWTAQLIFFCHCYTVKGEQHKGLQFWNAIFCAMLG